jgi:hypothetical protein
MEKLKTFTIQKNKIPYKIDLFVLEQLQESYWNIWDFERELKGLKIKTDKNGDPVYKDGTFMLERMHFSIKALNTILPLMVNEGLEIDADQRKKEFIPVDDKEFIRSIDINPYELQRLVVEEFDRCFDIKK